MDQDKDSKLLNCSNKRQRSEEEDQQQRPTNSDAIPSTVKKQTRKRRSLSCLKCRKLKTRCDFDPQKGMCYRCSVLRLPCSLSDGNAAKPTLNGLKAEDSFNNGSDSSATSSINYNHGINEEAITIDSRLRGLEQGIQAIYEYLRALTPVMQTQRISVSTPNVQINSQGVGLPSSFSALSDSTNISSNRLRTDHNAAPLSRIRSIDYKLFSRAEKYEAMNIAGREIVEWISQRPQYCQKMAHIFLSKCCRDVIRTELSLSHLTEQSSVLLQGALVLQGMRCDEKSSHDELQPHLYTMVRRLLSTALMTTPLLYEDIEAMLYLAHFNIARKPNQPIFDSWLLTGSAVKLYLLSVDFYDVVVRTDKGSSGEGDLYLFRLWNGICLCHLQYSVATWRPVMIPSDYLDQCGKISTMMGCNPIDTTNSAEIALLVILSHHLGILSSSYDFPRAINEWKAKYEYHFASDQAHMLEISYAYAHVILGCKFIHDHRETPEMIPRQVYQDAISFSSSIIRMFLDLPPSKIDGMPNYPLCILIYACLTLTSFLQQTDDRHSTLNLITKVYWYLYHMGERSKDIINSISLIIKSLIENASHKVLGSPYSENIDTPQENIKTMYSATTKSSVANEAAQVNSTMAQTAHTAQIPQIIQVPQPSDVQDLYQGYSSDPKRNINDENSSLLPDISQYQTFDEFFEVIFSRVNLPMTA